MTKSELMEALAESRGLSRRTAEEVVNVIFDGMRDVLKSGGRIEIRGFGSFKVRQYKGRTGRNPKTGAEILVKPKITKHTRLLVLFSKLDEHVSIF